MNPIILVQDVEVYQSHTKEYWIRKIIGFDKWIEENYNKYHKKHEISNNENGTNKN